MGKRGIAALIIGVSLLSGAGMIGLIVLVKTAGDRRAASRERARADVDQMRARDRDRQNDAVLLPDRVADPVADWPEVASAFANPKAPPADEAAEFTPIFEALGRALEREDKPAVDGLTDRKRFVQELIRGSGWQADTPARTQNELETEFREHLAQCFVGNKGQRWRHTDIRRIDRHGGTEVSIYTVHRSGTGESFKACWWLVRRADGWKVFDTTDLYLGLRLSRDPETLNAPEVVLINAFERGRYAAAREALSAATRAMNSGQNADAADAALGPARGLQLAPEDAALRAIIEGRIAVRRRAFGAALRHFEEAERFVPEMPAAASYRAFALNEAERYEEALDAIREYQRRCGPDAHAFVAEGFALAGLGRDPESAGAYRRALDDDPDAADALRGLCRVLPADEKGELGTRLAKARDPRRLYDAMVRSSFGERDERAADVLLDALRKARPNDTRALGDDIRRKVKSEKFDEAKKLMERGLRAALRTEREVVLDSYLFAMLGAKKIGEAYAAVPTEYAPDAFRTLADDLDNEDFDRADEKPGAQLAQLKELLAAHQKRVPNDPWIWFYQGAVYQQEKEYDKAAEAFATGGARLPKVPADDPDGPNDAIRFRARRVQCMFSAKKGLEAYEKVEPTADVFRQLAGLYDRADDFDGLATLLAAHRKREPNDLQAVYWQGHLRFRKGEYARATVLFKKFVLETDEKAPNWWSARDEYIRGTLRTKPEDAAKLLTELDPERGSQSLRAAVAAATGDRPELERLLAQATKSGAKMWFYTDEDFRRAINQEQWRDLRAKYPDPNSAKVDD